MRLRPRPCPSPVTVTKVWYFLSPPADTHPLGAFNVSGDSSQVVGEYVKQALMTYRHSLEFPLHFNMPSLGFQKAINRALKGRLLQGQKTAFCTAVRNVLIASGLPHAMRVVANARGVCVPHGRLWLLCMLHVYCRRNVADVGAACILRRPFGRCNKTDWP